MLNTEDSQLLDALRGLRWPARRLPRTATNGAHLSRNLGPSAELAEYRAYRPGDETRRIDWKLLARTNRVSIRLAQNPSQLTTMLVLDASASMAWPTASLAKWTQARRLALALGAATHQAGDAVGLMVAQGLADEPSDAGAPARSHQHLHMLAPRTQAGTVQRLAQLLRSLQPQGLVDLAPLLQQCRQQRLVVISDFLGSEADVERQCTIAGQLCAQGREVHALHVVDPAELEPPGGLDVLRDSRNPDLRRHMGAKARAQYQRNFSQWREALAAHWRRRGAYFSTVISDAPTAQLARRIVLNVPTSAETAR